MHDLVKVDSFEQLERLSSLVDQFNSFHGQFDVFKYDSRRLLFYHQCLFLQLFLSSGLFAHQMTPVEFLNELRGSDFVAHIVHEVLHMYIGFCTDDFQVLLLELVRVDVHDGLALRYFDFLDCVIMVPGKVKTITR